MLVMLKKRIPTIFGILLLLIGITVGVYLVEIGPESLTTRAGPEAVPSGINITNVSDVSFSVSWQTESEVIGFLKYSTNPSSLNLSALDDRDQFEAGDRIYTTHYVTVSELLPETTYYFKIVSGTESSEFDDEGLPYSVTTGPSLENISVADTAYGSIFYPDLSPTEGAIVFVTIDGAAIMSSLSGPSGTWAVPLSSARSADLSTFIDYDREVAELTIEIVSPEGSKSEAVTTTANDTPVEDILVGKSYDFSETLTQDESDIGTDESQFSVEPFDTIPETISSLVTVDNISEGESVNSTNPEFIGSGPPGASIEVTLESEDPIQANVVVNEDGSWSWVPVSSLEPGEHTLSLRWVDDNGITQTLNRSFTVFAQGESDLPAFESTPSATPTTPITTPTPTVTSAPTASPSATPTSQPSPTVTPTTATDPALPTPGTGFMSLFMVIAGLMIIVTGSFLLFYRRASL
jgi:hypothetical protein